MASNVVGSVSIELRARLDKLEADLRKGEASLKSWAGSVGTLVGAGLGASIGLALRHVITAASESDTEINKLNQTLRATSQFTPQYAGALRDLAQHFQRTTAFSHELTLSVARQLIQYGASGVEIKKYTGIVLDLAASGRGLEGSTDAVGKAISGRFTLLARLLGIELDANSTRAQKQSRVFEELGRRVTGQAAAALDTYRGKLAQLGNAFNDLEEEIGSLVVTSTVIRSAIERLTGTTFEAAGGVHDWAAKNHELIEQNIAGVIDGIGTATQGAATAFKVFGAATATFLSVWKELPPEVKGLIIGGVAGGRIGAAAGVVVGLGTRIAGDADSRARLHAALPEVFGAAAGLPAAATSPSVGALGGLTGIEGQTLIAPGAWTSLDARLAAGGKGFVQPPANEDVQRGLDTAVKTAEAQQKLAQNAYDLAKARGAVEVDLQTRLNGLDAANVALVRAKAAAEQGKVSAQGLAAELGATELKTLQEQLGIQEQLSAARQSFADADIAYAQNALTNLDQRFALEQRHGATRAELLDLATQQDEAETRVLQTERARLEVAYNQIDAKRTDGELSQQNAAALDNLNAQIAGINDQLALGPQHVRDLHQEFINLGDTLDGIFANFITGLATGTNTQGFSDLGKQVGQAFVGELIRSTIKEKGLFDIKIKANFLELVGFSGKAGDDAGQGFVGGLLDKVKGLFGGGGIPDKTSLSAAGIGTGASFQSGPTPVKIVSFDAPLTAREAALLNPRVTPQGGNAAQVAAFNAQGGAGLSNFAGGAAIVGEVAGGTTALVEGLKGKKRAVEHLIREQAILTHFEETTRSQVKTGAGKGIHIPTAESQVQTAVDKIFNELDLPKGLNRFRGNVLGRDLDDLIRKTPSLAARITSGSVAPEALRPLTADIAPLITRGNIGVATAFTNTFIQNARILKLTAQQTSDELFKIAGATLTLDQAVDQLNKQFLEGDRTIGEYETGLGALLQLLAAPDSKIVDAATLATGLVGQGYKTTKEIKQLVATATSAITGGVVDAFTVLLDGGSAVDAGAAIGASFGKAIADEAEQKILDANVGKFLTAASLDFSQAADALIAGDHAKFLSLEAKGLADFKIGKAGALTFLQSVAPDLRELRQKLSGGTTAAGITDQGGLTFPRFAEGGYMPHTGLAHLERGELVSTTSQQNEAVGLLRTIATHMVGGQRITIHVDAPAPAPVIIDGRVLVRSIDDAHTRQRVGVSMPNAMLGVRR